MEKILLSKMSDDSALAAELARSNSCLYNPLVIYDEQCKLLMGAMYYVYIYASMDIVIMPQEFEIQCIYDKCDEILLWSCAVYLIICKF